MDEEKLSDTAIQGDLPRIEPENGQGLRDCACGEDKVCSSQHAEEEVHGFMEAPFQEDNEDEQAVPKQGDDIGHEEGDGDPHVLVLKARDAHKIEDCVANASMVKGSHTWSRVLEPHPLLTDTIKISDFTQSS